MNRKDYILFDLDGTLTDPKEGITKLVQYALEYFGIQTDGLDSLTSFIGPPLGDSFKRCYGLSDEQAREGVQTYREYFSVRGWVQNKEYPGTEEMLEALKGVGRVLLVATSKPEEFAKKIPDRFDMAEYFGFISGVDMGETRVCKTDVVRYVLEQCGLESDDEAIGRCIMMGGREHDTLGSRGCGMGYVGILYGYGDRQEVDVCGPAWIVEAVKDSRGLFLPL